MSTGLSKFQVVSHPFLKTKFGLYGQRADILHQPFQAVLNFAPTISGPFTRAQKYTKTKAF